MLAIGARTPSEGQKKVSQRDHDLRRDEGSRAQGRWRERDRGKGGLLTPKEASQLLGAVCMLHAIKEAFVSVGLHSCFHAIEGKGEDSREHARRAGGDLGAVALDQPLRALFLSSRHDRSRLAGRNMVYLVIFGFCRWHASSSDEMAAPSDGDLVRGDQGLQRGRDTALCQLGFWSIQTAQQVELWWCGRATNRVR